MFRFHCGGFQLSYPCSIRIRVSTLAAMTRLGVLRPDLDSETLRAIQPRDLNYYARVCEAQIVHEKEAKVCANIENARGRASSTAVMARNFLPTLTLPQAKQIVAMCIHLRQGCQPYILNLHMNWRIILWRCDHYGQASPDDCVQLMSMSERITSRLASRIF